MISARHLASYVMMLLGSTSHLYSPCYHIHTKSLFEGSEVHNSGLVLDVHLPGKQHGMTTVEKSLDTSEVWRRFLLVQNCREK